MRQSDIADRVPTADLEDLDHLRVVTDEPVGPIGFGLARHSPYRGGARSPVPKHSIDDAAQLMQVERLDEEVGGALTHGCGDR